MHFFYVDETGCTGADLANAEQPIFVIGGIDVTDEKWRETNGVIRQVLKDFFGGELPENFELHAHDLVNGEGVFTEKERAERNTLAHSLLDTIASRGHGIRFVEIDKGKLSAAAPAQHAVIDCRIPYQLRLQLFSDLYRAVRERAPWCEPARGMIILDKKDMYQDKMDRLTHYRRYKVPNVRRLKRIVEFSYPVGLRSAPDDPAV